MMNDILVTSGSESQSSNLWQSSAWARFQESLGRSTRLYRHLDAAALVVIDKGAGGFSTWDIPRGPTFTKAETGILLLNRIAHDARSERCIELTWSPEKALTIPGAQTSKRHVQPEATSVVDLSRTEAEILAAMHQKGRYNIRVAEKAGVTVREGSGRDMDAMYELLKATGGRDSFTIAQKSQYARFLSDLEGSFMLLAEHEGRPISGLLGVIHGSTGVYYYGASDYTHRHLMAPYLLQWRGMQHCKDASCTHYDLLGISPDNAGINDPWRGITEFKRKFGGSVVTYPPEQVIVFKPIVKAALRLKRKILG